MDAGELMLFLVEGEYIRWDEDKWNKTIAFLFSGQCSRAASLSDGFIEFGQLVLGISNKSLEGKTK